MAEPRQIFIALFAYAGVTPATHDCLIRDLPGLGRVRYHRESKDALISRSRSVAASEFLRSDSEVLLMIDHDMAWAPGDLERLAQKVAETRSIVAGVYSKRCFGAGVAVRFEEPGEYPLGVDRLVRGRYVSTGFFGAHREVFEKLAETLPLTREDFWPFFLPMLSTPENGDPRPEYLSEDWAFCERARAAGFEVYVDLWPRLVHGGSHAYRVIDSQLELPSQTEVTLRS